MIKSFKIILIACVFVFLSSQNVRLEDYTSSINALAKLLKKKGYETEQLFSHPKFKIYENIDSYYTQSPEKKGKSAYQKALGKGDKKEADRIFNEEYKKYKENIGFGTKKKRMASFVQKYSAHLILTEKKFNIPWKVIAAIIGLESNFGTITGRYNCFNVYVSMYVKNYRKKFALSQIEELLQFTNITNHDIFELNSSYAGAIGYMQFLPYSLNRWFVGDNVFDMNDTISSVANYLSHFKKKRGTLEKAVYSYNPSRFYVKTVFELAEHGK